MRLFPTRCWLVDLFTTDPYRVIQGPRHGVLVVQKLADKLELLHLYHWPMCTSLGPWYKGSVVNRWTSCPLERESLIHDCTCSGRAGFGGTCNFSSHIVSIYKVRGLQLLSWCTLVCAHYCVRRILEVHTCSSQLIWQHFVQLQLLLPQLWIQLHPLVLPSVFWIRFGVFEHIHPCQSLFHNTATKKLTTGYFAVHTDPVPSGSSPGTVTIGTSIGLSQALLRTTRSSH